MQAVSARRDGGAIDPDRTVINGKMIYYPTLKLCVRSAGQKELDSSSFTMGIDYDPLIEAGALMMVLPDDEREMMRQVPVLAAKADDPVPFRSRQSRRAGAKGGETLIRYDILKTLPNQHDNGHVLLFGELLNGRCST